MYELKCALFMFDYNHKMLPNSFTNFFQAHQNVYNTRSQPSLIQEFSRTDFTKKLPKHTFPEIWNTFHRMAEQCDSRGVFKSKLKIHFMQRYDNIVLNCNNPNCPDCTARV